MHNTLQLSEMRTPHYSVKRIDFAVPLVQNSLDNADAGRPLAQDCPAPLVDSTNEYYTNTGMHSSSLWLSFLAIVQQGRALERRLRSAQRHEYALPRLPEIYRKPPK